ncbi:hypothetical protein ZEAMMB73_Zm00001d027315 [Zea mays]|uniref:Uncharacterized protein n=1 Tax=Zea mays TaxID=4577 RepID=A0A1D6JKP0_MAIZE|nr:hypothetical protein ZEAMMB73_Zm00001d027315 [Zea mays]
MEAGRESSKAKRARAAMSNEDDTTSQGNAGGGAAASAAETEGDEMAVVAAEAEAEADEQVGSAETEEHIQRILLAIDNYTRQVSDMLDAGRALFKDLAADFEDRLCSYDPQGEGGAVGGGDPGAARPRRRQRAGPRPPPQRPAAPPPHRPRLTDRPIHPDLSSNNLPAHHCCLSRMIVLYYACVHI